MAYNISIAVVYLFELLISYIFFNQVSVLKKDKKLTLLIGVIWYRNDTEYYFLHNLAEFCYLLFSELLSFCFMF